MALNGVCNPAGLPAWSRVADIGDYGGSLDKVDSVTEGETPYTLQVYMGLRSMRGSGYSQNTTDLVHVENLAMARTLSTVFFRVPEKMRANAVPARSDERLPYWATVLGVPVRDGEPPRLTRQRCAANYQAAVGPDLDAVTTAVSDLLGDAYVAVYTTTGASLSSPPALTYWPGINAGSTSYDLGGGTWLSSRCHFFVETQHPAGMSDADYFNLIDVQLFQLLDRMLPAWATFNYGTLGFLLDVSELDVTAFGT